jgi:hypothetical protein
MNIYIATKNNLVGVVLAGTHNKIYMFKAFQTETTDKDTQTLLATQRAVGFAIGNKVIYAGNDINLYTEDDVDLDKLRSNEYLSRYNLPINKREAVTDEEKHHLRLAHNEIDLRFVRWNGYSR